MKDLHTDKIANFSAVLIKAFELLQQVRDVLPNKFIYCNITNYWCGICNGQNGLGAGCLLPVIILAMLPVPSSPFPRCSIGSRNSMLLQSLSSFGASSDPALSWNQSK